MCLEKNSYDIRKLGQGIYAAHELGENAGTPKMQAFLGCRRISKTD